MSSGHVDGPAGAGAGGHVTLNLAFSQCAEHLKYFVSPAWTSEIIVFLLGDEEVGCNMLTL